jgi:hypothetical protein
MKQALYKQTVCGVDLPGSGYNPVADSCEHAIMNLLGSLNSSKFPQGIGQVKDYCNRLGI